MDPRLYRAAATGNVDYLGRIRDDDDVVHERTPKDNNVLHIAAEFKQVDFFRHLSHDARYRPLFWGTNKKGDTPLHLAARVGCGKIVEFLIKHAKEPHDDEESGPADDDDGEAHYKRLLRITNWQKDTALHLAARFGHKGVVTSLMEADPELCCLTNNANESPLFIATSRGFLHTALSIVNDSPISPSYQGTNNVTALHAAAARKTINSRRLMDIIVSKNPDIIKAVDALGWTPLHYAALRGHLEAVQILMKGDSSASYISDKSGMSALHVAAFAGRTKVMQEVIRNLPDTCDLLNHKGQTILHAAVLGGLSKVVKFILKTPKLARLINDADEDGNTPLHLAVIYRYNKIVRILIGDPRVDKTAINNDWLKPADIFLANSSEQDTLMLPRFYSRMKSCIGVPYFHEQIQCEFMKLESLKNDASNTLASGDNTQKMKASSSNEDSKTFDTNLLVATLIATVTFTAAFTIPGGFKSDGMPVLQDKAAFYVFLIFDALSFFISILSVFLNFTAATLFRGHRYARSSLIQCSIVGMIIAFASSIFIVLPKYSPLGIAIYVICALLCLIIMFTFKALPSKRTRKIRWLRTRRF